MVNAVIVLAVIGLGFIGVVVLLEQVFRMEKKKLLEEIAQLKLKIDALKRAYSELLRGYEKEKAKAIK